MGADVDDGVAGPHMVEGDSEVGPLVPAEPTQVVGRVVVTEAGEAAMGGRQDFDLIGRDGDFAVIGDPSLRPS